MKKINFIVLPVVILGLSIFLNIHRFDLSIVKAAFHIGGLFVFLYGLMLVFKEKTLLRLLFSLMLSVEVFSQLSYGASMSLGTLMSVVNTSGGELLAFVAFNYLAIIISVVVFSCLLLLKAPPYLKRLKVALPILFIGVAYVCVPSFIGQDTEQNRGNYRFALLSGKVRDQAELVTKVEYYLKLMSQRLSIIKQVLVINDAYHFFSLQGSSSSSSWTNVSALADGRDLIVIGIGESLRANNMGIYGYQRNTTPNLMSMGDELTVFENAYAAGVNTWVSVPTSLTKMSDVTKPDISLSIVNLAKEAGYTVYWISNQPKTSHWDYSTSAIAAQADNIYFMQDGEDVESYDSSIVDHFVETLSSSKDKEKRLFVLHFFGSHMTFEDRYPPEFEVLSGNEGYLDSYDNSVLYTDHIQKNIINVVKKERGKYLFFSDHGLVKPGDNLEFKHDVRENLNLESIKVPLFTSGDAFPLPSKENIISLYYFECIFSSWSGISADQLSDDGYCQKVLENPSVTFIDMNFIKHEWAAF